MTIHPLWNGTNPLHMDQFFGNMDFDFGIVSLCEPLMFDEGILLSHSISLIKICSIAAQPICLPDPTQDYDNVSTVVTGWGQNHTDPKDTSVPAILQEGNLTTITNSQCKKAKWASPLLPLMITDKMICALNPKEGICHGDSGGPMITLSKNGTYQQIGISSWNDAIIANLKDIILDPNVKPNVTSQCLLESPNVFSRVTAQLDWINKMIKRQ